MTIDKTDRHIQKPEQKNRSTIEKTDRHIQKPEQKNRSTIEKTVQVMAIREDESSDSKRRGDT